MFSPMIFATSCVQTSFRGFVWRTAGDVEMAEKSAPVGPPPWGIVIKPQRSGARAMA